MTCKYAVYCGNEAVHKAMSASCRSLLAHSTVDHVWMLTDKSPGSDAVEDLRVEWQVVDNQWWRADGPNMSSNYTWLAMLRAALCYVLPVDRVLSLDCDTVCVGDVDGVWDIDVSDAYFAASTEAHKTHDGFLYTNTGVCLYNLEKLRDGKAAEVIEVLDKRRYTWLEQDVMNYLCQGRIVEMPSEYNANDWTAPCAAPRIKHFAGVRDYLGEPVFHEWL